MSCSITISSDSIQPSAQAQNLGVIFDETLSLRSHIASSCTLQRSSRIWWFLTQFAAKTPIHSFISSRLDYCNSALCWLPEADINKVQCIQNVAAHLVTYMKKYAHIMPVPAELHWLPIQSRILFKILVLTYKVLYGLAPHYIQSLLTPYIPTWALCSAAKLYLVIPHSNTLSYGARAFSRFAPKQFNLLPQAIAQAPTLPIFKGQGNNLC